MSDDVQPGTKVDAELWDRFREDVKRRKGGTRGHLRTELENALRAYIGGDEPTPADLDSRLQRIEAAVGAAPTDGGRDTLPDDTHTHAPTSKPGPNATRSKKVEYLISEKYDRDGGSVKPETVIEDVQEIYAFEKRTAEKYVQPVIDKLDAKRHPNNQNLLVWGAVRERLRDGLAEE